MGQLKSMKSFDIKLISTQFGLTPEQFDTKVSIFALDEVGRGPLAGPVVSGCVHVEGNLADFQSVLKNLKKLKVTDSKKLSKVNREEILQCLNIDIEKVQDKIPFSLDIKGMEVKIVLVEIDNYKIDKINILQASLESMRVGFELLYQPGKQQNNLTIVDGNKLFKVPEEVPALSIIEGDSKSLLIGLASIVAKVYRDRLMAKFDQMYPGYEFLTNAGYPSIAHRKAIQKLGPTAIHRATFKGVREYASVGERK